jgi:hypothetical protein
MLFRDTNQSGVDALMLSDFWNVIVVLISSVVFIFENISSRPLVLGVLLAIAYALGPPARLLHTRAHTAGHVAPSIAH